ncbi:hypothetical protein [Mycobacterium colombiense]|uniref:hypothetical protein n=1 Tax=Mycobacterium colombiense TaxID=339268 RepID=UPI00200B00A3|nr:hypothetical protein [Mycobacterium colombiense]MCK8645637.1 hypothetical protein [Mycobacterium colombiense]
MRCNAHLSGPPVPEGIASKQHSREEIAIMTNTNGHPTVATVETLTAEAELS